MISHLRESSGAGEFRGGLGARIRLAKRYDDGTSVTVFVSPEGVNAPISGLFGGQHGLLSHGYVRDEDGNILEDVGTGGLFVVDRTDRVVELQLGGGAGFGDPANRSVELIEDDVREDYISAETAETTYGLSERKKELAASARLAPAAGR